MTTNQPFIAQLLAEDESDTAAIKAKRENFDREIALQEAALEERRRVIRYLEQRELAKNPSPLSEKQINAPSQDAPPQSPEAKASFTSIVADVVKKLETQEVTNSDVYAKIVESGVTLPVQPRIQVATILARLQKKGLLEKQLTSDGKPNGYRKVEK